MNVDPQDPSTHLKAGSSTNPEKRYNLRSSKKDTFQRIEKSDIIAKSDGHSREIEEAIIKTLRQEEISANVKQDCGQKPPFVQMNGEVFYYLARKQPGTESNKQEPTKTASKAQLKEAGKSQTSTKPSTKKQVAPKTKKADKN